MSASATFRHDSPGVIAPPPLIFASVLILGIAIDRLVAGESNLVPAWAYVIASGLAVAAAIFLVGALGLFRKARTRAEPWKPTTAIVTAGLYRITRNPMYVGMALAYAGVAVFLGSAVALALLPVALAAIHYGAVMQEERYLEGKFGDEYLGYKARVRRWL